MTTVYGFRKVANDNAHGFMCQSFLQKIVPKIKVI